MDSCDCKFWESAFDNQSSRPKPNATYLRPIDAWLTPSLTSRMMHDILTLIPCALAHDTQDTPWFRIWPRHLGLVSKPCESIETSDRLLWFEIVFFQWWRSGPQGQIVATNHYLWLESEKVLPPVLNIQIFQTQKGLETYYVCIVVHSESRFRRERGGLIFSCLII
jgi:hypothetical protein